MFTSELETVGPPGDYSGPALSPDATKLAVAVRDPETKTRDIWVFDLNRATASRLTFNTADEFNAVWSPDSTRVFFTFDRNGQRFLMIVPASEAKPSPITVVVNGPALLKKK